MEQKDIKTILDRYKAGAAGEEELALLESWYLGFAEPADGTLSEDERLETFGRVWANLEKGQTAPKTTPLWPRIAAAAAILVFLSFGLYQYLHTTVTLVKPYANDIAPGSNQPVLTLVGGQMITLNNKQGTIARQGAVTIQKNAAGRLVYTAGNTSITDAPFNTLTNPRGSKIVSLVLPDGTLVKLDAASSITYPTAFTDKVRRVTTTGKAYFAVTYHNTQPFYVTTRGQVTQDLGTKFMVEAYEDEPAVKTTLIEGRVAVSKNGQQALLMPGQQAIVQPAGNTIVVQHADLDEETAWISGDFDFHNEALGSIMRQLARVYNIEVIYRGNVQNLLFDGMVSRSRNLSAALSLMEGSGKIHFEVNGRRVMVITGAR